jgi:hypothetical protein
MHPYKNQLLKKKYEIVSLVCERNNREESFTGLQELLANNFGTFLELIYQNYPQFCEHLSFYLAWDAFCSMHPAGISKDLLAQRKLAFWNRYNRDGEILPVGKIVDNFTEKQFKNTIDCNPHLKSFFKDMVDSEAITYVILGNPDKVNFITFDKPNVITDRIKLIHGAINHLEDILKCKITKHFGKVYCLNESNEIRDPKVIESSEIIKL